MVDYLFREIPEQTMKALDSRAEKAGLSRQKYLHHITDLHLGLNTNPSVLISARLKQVLEDLARIKSDFGVEPPDLVTLAKHLGHRDTTELEQVLAGDRSLSLVDVDPVCELLGINKQWLLRGTESPYVQPATFRDGSACLHLLNNEYLESGYELFEVGKAYKAWYFLISEGKESQGAIFGRPAAEPYRLELLLRRQPLNEHVGRTGAGQIVDFCLLCAAIDPTLGTSTGLGRILKTSFDCWGRILRKSQFDDLIEGRIHPGHVLSSATGHSPWFEDIWDFEYERTDYTPGYADAKKIFRIEMEAENVKDNKGLHAYLKKALHHRQGAGMASTATGPNDPPSARS